MPQIEEAELSQLREAASRVSTLEAERDQARKERDDAIAEKRARDLADAATKRVREAVKDLPAHMGERVVESTVGADLPVKDNRLDEAAFDQLVEAAIKKEQEYAAALAPKGVHGFGASVPATESKSGPATVNPWGREIKEG